MIGCGTATFTDPEDYRVSVPGVSINLVLTAPCNFKVRLTWIEIRRLRLARCEESAPRIAFVALAQGPIFVSFPIRHDPPPVWSGVEMRPGEIVLHRSGDRIYQRTSGAGAAPSNENSEAINRTRGGPAALARAGKPPRRDQARHHR